MVGAQALCRYSADCGGSGVLARLNILSRSATTPNSNYLVRSAFLSWGPGLRQVPAMGDLMLFEESFIRNVFEMCTMFHGRTTGTAPEDHMPFKPA